MADPPADAPRHAARLTERRDGHPLVPIALEVDADVRTTHTTPGQYLSIVVAGENGYFVIASEIGALAWRLLVKGGGTVADALLAEPLGATFSITAALGAGFPCDEARGRPLVVAAAGTGIASVPPVATRRVAEGDAARTTVLLGLQRAADLPCAEDVAAWRAAGMAVLLCVSREEHHDTGSFRGYVQDVARAQVRPADRTMIFAVGPAAMVDGTREIAAQLGAAPGDVRTNY